MATVRLPRLLTGSVKSGLRHEVSGSTLSQALDSLFSIEPGLRTHLLDEQGAIRPHVLIFVDGVRGSLEDGVGAGSKIQVLQAVSGGGVEV
jgi:sulfur-carrier protein